MSYHPAIFPDRYQLLSVDDIDTLNQDYRSSVSWNDVNLKDIRRPLIMADPGKLEPKKSQIEVSF